MKTNKYKFKQSELYTIARLVLNLTLSAIARFTAFKGKYTAPWVADRQLEVDDTEDLPDEDQRDEQHQTLHVDLDKLVVKATQKFTALTRYIKEVFEEDVWEIKIDAAGGSYYTAAAGGDFDATKQLLTKGKKFIDDNLATLEDSGNNMPAAFQTEFGLLKTNFTTKHNLFLTAEVTAETGTENKIDDNNLLYKLITSINADAQSIFLEEGEESIRQQFVLEHQLQLVRGAGVAGMRFHITNTTTEEDLQDVTITIKPGVTVTTDQNGRALKLQLAAETYSVKFQKTGYTAQEIEITVTTGTVKRVNVQLLQL